ncbi:ABC transporter substrate-binding protein [Clostridium felsineum]|uniref:ABC transporter substrate-binding protein n=1 Tax=Clostridium felsineum TaxID=36839 RepID=UPI00098BE20B|nr:spermidine/putrescine ABC transporter substrate-binding protein [Clostridium felsineum]URZ00264.1 Spermidine/putrescine-binding periplasmic protein [Clostridium felsineum]
MVHKKVKRIISVVLITMMAAVVFTGCVGSKNAEDSGGTLNVFNWTEYLPKSVIKEFENKYHIKVNYTTYSSNEEMLAKVQASSGQYDVAVASDYMVDIMKKQKLLEEVDKSNISNLKNIGADYKNQFFDPGNKYSIPYLCGNVVVVVNTKKFPEGITSYGDLWDSKFKGSMVVLDDERAIIGMALKKLGYSLNETDTNKLNQAKEELKKLKPNIKLFDSDSPKTSLINGEASVGFCWTAEAYLAEKDNKDLKTFFPKEGLYANEDNLVIPKDAKNKKNAELFMNFILDPKVSVEISKAYPYANPNDAARKMLGSEYTDNKTIYPDKDVVDKSEHVKDLGDTTKLYDSIWTEFKQ